MTPDCIQAALDFERKLFGGTAPSSPFPDQNFEGCALESKSGPKLILQKAGIRRGQTFGVGAEENEGRRMNADLGPVLKLDRSPSLAVARHARRVSRDGVLQPSV